MSVLDPDVIRRADRFAVSNESDAVLRGAVPVTQEAMRHVASAQFASTALIDGAVGLIVAPAGRLTMALRCEFTSELIKRFEVIAEPKALSRLEIQLC